MSLTEGSLVQNVTVKYLTSWSSLSVARFAHFPAYADAARASASMFNSLVIVSLVCSANAVQLTTNALTQLSPVLTTRIPTYLYAFPLFPPIPTPPPRCGAHYIQASTWKPALKLTPTVLDPSGVPNDIHDACHYPLSTSLHRAHNSLSPSALRYIEWGVTPWIPLSVFSPHTLRVLGTLSNSQEFADAFSCGANTPYNPKEKCQLW